MASDGCESNNGLQFRPESIVFQTPPFADPRYAIAAFVGSWAIVVTRPDQGAAPLYMLAWPAGIGVGPIDDQAPTVATADLLLGAATAAASR
jgi:hypothetical protein